MKKDIKVATAATNIKFGARREWEVWEVWVVGDGVGRRRGVGLVLGIG